MRIQERLENINALRRKIRHLNKNEVSEDFAFIRSLVKSKPIFQSENDFSNSSREEIVNWFRGLGITENLVNVYWHSNNEGVSVNFETFVENFDEFWYPSSDDIWVTGNDKSWLIQIDHEEKFSFFCFN